MQIKSEFTHFFLRVPLLLNLHFLKVLKTLAFQNFLGKEFTHFYEKNINLFGFIF
jgi:hypothetical protein